MTPSLSVTPSPAAPALAPSSGARGTSTATNGPTFDQHLAQAHQKAATLDSGARNTPSPPAAPQTGPGAEASSPSADGTSVSKGLGPSDATEAADSSMVGRPRADAGVGEADRAETDAKDTEPETSALAGAGAVAALLQGLVATPLMATPRLAPSAGEPLSTRPGGIPAHGPLQAAPLAAISPEALPSPALHGADVTPPEAAPSPIASVLAATPRREPGRLVAAETAPANGAVPGAADGVAGRPDVLARAGLTGTPALLVDRAIVTGTATPARDASPSPGGVDHAPEGTLGPWLTPGTAGPSLAPGPVPTLSLPTPVHDPEFPHDLSQQITWLGTQAVKQAKIELHPKDMGHIEVNITVQHTRVDVTFAVQHPAAEQAVQQSLPQLQTMLAQHGLNLGQASVGQQQQRPDEGRPHRTGRGETDDRRIQDTPDVERVTLMARRSLGLLDTFA